MLGVADDEMTLIMKLQGVACTRLEVTAVSQKRAVAWLPLIRGDDITPSSPGQGASHLPCSPGSERVSREKASWEPDSYVGVCSPAVPARLPWWD